MKNHPSHNVRSSDASSFDEICDDCGATDAGRGEALARPCPAANAEVPAIAPQLFDIDAYGDFVDEMWFPSKGGLTERDFRIMELGLPGEVGEVLELLKKNVRDGNLDRANLKKELGDVIYYWARICTAYGFKPSEVILANVEKIEGRHNRGTLKGSGNDR